MYIIINTDDESDLSVIKSDPLTSNDAERTLYFAEEEEAYDYAEQNCGEFVIVEIDT